MEQKEDHSKACVDQDFTAEYSLSFSGLLCLQQQTISDAPDKTRNASSKPEPDFKFDSTKPRAVKPAVSYDNLAVLLPRCESSGRRAASPDRPSSNGERGKKDPNRKKKKSGFKSIFEPCRVCRAVEPSAIKDQNPSAGRNQSSH
uniref:Uncharacterized protein n=1 Tax=Kalanchoe fedtschenkoi TaxID=63787 RepID=A0A7N0TKT6_KALFE